MARQNVWKDALYKGTWVTTKGQVFHCDDNDLKHFLTRTKDMISKGARIPWCFEHQHDDDVDSANLSASDLLARWAKNTGGHIHDVRITPDGCAIEVLMDIECDQRDQNGKTGRDYLEAIKHVSPDIRYNWRDRNGPESDDIGPFWPGQSFAHIAVTPLPVQYPQKPFDFSQIGKAEVDGTRAVGLSAAKECISLSSATLRPISLSKEEHASLHVGPVQHAHERSEVAHRATTIAHKSKSIPDHREAMESHSNAGASHLRAAATYEGPGIVTNHAAIKKHRDAAALHYTWSGHHAGVLREMHGAKSLSHGKIGGQATDHVQKASDSSMSANKMTRESHKLDTPQMHGMASEAHMKASQDHKRAAVHYRDGKDHTSAAHHESMSDHHLDMSKYHKMMGEGMDRSAVKMSSAHGESYPGQLGLSPAGATHESQAKEYASHAERRSMRSQGDHGDAAHKLSVEAHAVTKKAIQSGSPSDHKAAAESHRKAAGMNLKAHHSGERYDDGYKNYDHYHAAVAHQNAAGHHTAAANRIQTVKMSSATVHPTRTARDGSLAANKATRVAYKDDSPKTHTAASKLHAKASADHKQAATHCRSKDKNPAVASYHDGMHEHHLALATYHTAMSEGKDSKSVKMSAGLPNQDLSTIAHDASHKAWTASTLAHRPGGDHAGASELHTAAQKAHRQAASAHAESGHGPAAHMHRQLADVHFSMAQDHGNLHHKQQSGGTSLSGANLQKNIFEESAVTLKMSSKDKDEDKTMPFDFEKDAKISEKDDDKGADKSDDKGGDVDISETETLETSPASDVDKTGDGATDDKDADAAQAMMELEHHLADMGIEFHGSAHDTLLNFVQHLNTAIATHKSTKSGGGGSGSDDEDKGKDDQKGQYQGMGQSSGTPSKEPEVAESAPIMMSASQAKPRISDREVALAKKLVKASNDNLRARMSALHQAGYIDDAIKKELLGELGGIRLSMSDLTVEGDLKPTTVSIRVEAYERLAKSKRPGSFVKPKAASPASSGSDAGRLKPISAPSFALSAAEDEEIVEPTDVDGAGDGEDRPVVTSIVNRLSGGRYDGYLKTKNGTPQ